MGYGTETIVTHANKKTITGRTSRGITFPSYGTGSFYRAMASTTGSRPKSSFIPPDYSVPLFDIFVGPRLCESSHHHSSHTPHLPPRVGDRVQHTPLSIPIRLCDHLHRVWDLQTTDRQVARNSASLYCDITVADHSNTQPHTGTLIYATLPTRATCAYTFDSR